MVRQLQHLVGPASVVEQAAKGLDYIVDLAAVLVVHTLLAAVSAQVKVTVRAAGRSQEVFHRWRHRARCHALVPHRCPAVELPCIVGEVVGANPRCPVVGHHARWH